MLCFCGMNQKGNIVEENDPEDTVQTESLKKVSNMTKKQENHSSCKLLTAHSTPIIEKL